MLFTNMREWQPPTVCLHLKTGKILVSTYAGLLRIITRL